jgi:hypothetical protein
MRDGQGSLFKNDRKESDNHPNAKGAALIGGVEYWVSAWTKVDKNGNRWQSLSFQPKEAKAKAPISNAPAFDEDNDIPF